MALGTRLVKSEMALAARTARNVLKKIVDAHCLADNVIFINRDIIALNKPYGIPVHGGPGVKTNILDMLDEFTAIKKLKEKPELAHRIDKDCSGILILTRSKMAAQRMAEMFYLRKVVKSYWAVTIGVPVYDKGEINIPLGEGKVGRWHRIIPGTDLIGKTQKELVGSGFKEAITKFQILDANLSTCSLLELRPTTGVKQQIRVHLANGLKCPVLGDHKFSSEEPQPQVLPLRMLQLLEMRGVRKEDDPKGKGRIRAWQRGMIPLHLHARQITFPKFDNGKDLTITAPLPGHFEDTLEKLKLHPKRKNMTQSRDENMYFKLKRLGKSTKSIVGF